MLELAVLLKGIKEEKKFTERSIFMDQNQTEHRIEVFCLKLKDGKLEFYVLYLDRDRANRDMEEIPKKYPRTVVLDTPYPVWACPQTYQRICTNGGKLRQVSQTAPKCREVC